MPAFRTHRAPNWTDEEDHLLRTLADKGKSLTLLAVKLSRPMAAVKNRALDLGIQIVGTEIGERRKRR